VGVLGVVGVAPAPAGSGVVLLPAGLETLPGVPLGMPVPEVGIFTPEPAGLFLELGVVVVSGVVEGTLPGSVAPPPDMPPVDGAVDAPGVVVLGFFMEPVVGFLPFLTLGLA
jgi:hypothetical protein